MNAAHAVVKNAAIKEVNMPKFYRQNKKRIDPRYFLNETTYRDQLEENLMNPEQRSINARTIYYRLDKLLSKPEFSRHRQDLEQLMLKTSNTVGKKEGGLSDEEFTELVSAARDDSSLRAFQDRVMVMLSQGAMKGDIDSDGDVDPQDVADLAQQVAQSHRASKQSKPDDLDDFELETQ